jgi:site-specific recombinase XerD
MRATATKIRKAKATVQETVAVTAPAITLEEALAEFIEYKQRQGEKGKTCRDIRDTVNQYYSWMKCEFGEEKDFGTFLTLKKTRTPGTRYEGTIAMSGIVSDNTRNKRIIWCKAFWNFCIEQKYLKANPAEGFRTKKINRLASAPSTEAVKAVLERLYSDAMKPDAPWNTLRNATMMMIQVASGCRIADLIGVLPADVVRNGTARSGRYSIIIQGEREKTGQTRALTGLDAPEVVKLLDKLIEQWHTYTNTDADGNILPSDGKIQYWPASTYLFCSQDGEKLASASTVRKHLDKIAKELKVRDVWNARKFGGLTGVHDFRRYFATQYVLQQYEKAGSVDILTLGTMLGHSDLNTTRRYIDATIASRKLETTRSADLPIGGIFGSSASSVKNTLPKIGKRIPRKAKAVA